MNEDLPRAKSSSPISGDDTSKPVAEPLSDQNEVLSQNLQPVEKSQQRYERIALLAYQRAQARGFATGGELEDWLLAENEVDLQTPRR